jgi:hypothetical protein
VSRRSTSTITDLVLLLVLTLVVLATWLPRLAGPLDLRWDGGVYYVLGTALAEGRGYRLLNEPGEIEATQYPPLFPAFIAAHQLIAGTGDPTLIGRRLRVSFLALSLAFAWAGYALLRRHLPPAWAFLGMVMCAVHTSTVFLSDIAFADFPFALVTCLFFVSSKRDPERWEGATMGLLAMAAYLLRTIGITLLVGWIAEAALRGDIRRAAARLAVAAVPVLGWHAYVASIERAPSYAHPAYPYQRADYLFYNVSYAQNVGLRDPNQPDLGRVSPGGAALRVVGYLPTVPIKLGETISASRQSWRRQIARLKSLPMVGRWLPLRLADAGLLLLGAMILTGLALEVVRGERLVPLYVAMYVLVLCFIPWREEPRYWFPLAPLLLRAMWRCAVAITGKLEPRARFSPPWTRAALFAAAGVILLVQVMSLVDFYRDKHESVTYQDRNGQRVDYRLLYYREVYRAQDAGLDWLRQRASPTDIVATSMPHWVYLRTGLKTVMPPFERDPRHAEQLLESVPVSYMIVDGRTQSFTREYGLPVVQQAPERWPLVYSLPEGGLHIFQRAHPGSAAASVPRRDEE